MGERPFAPDFENEQEVVRLQQLLEDIKNGSFARVYLLYGEETYLRLQYRDKLKKALIPDGDTMNYHYFEGKDALLGSLSVLFDEKYEELRPRIDPEADAVETLVFLNRELFNMIDNSVSLELLARLFSSQLVTRGEKHLLDRNRTYFKLLYQIIRDGQSRGQLRTDMAANEIAKAYAMFERGMMYDWCLCGGEYALGRYSALMMPMFLQGFRPER